MTEIAEAVNAEPELVIEALEAAHAHSAQPLNTQAGVAGDGEELVELLDATDVGCERSDLRAEPKKAMAKLDTREQQVILLRFASGHTQSQIASTIGYSQMHISRIERHALARLRSAIDIPIESAA